jgi:hypothetical protein
MVHGPYPPKTSVHTPFSWHGIPTHECASAHRRSSGANANAACQRNVPRARSWTGRGRRGAMPKNCEVAHSAPHRPARTDRKAVRRHARSVRLLSVTCIAVEVRDLAKRTHTHVAPMRVDDALEERSVTNTAEAHETQNRSDKASSPAPWVIDRDRRSVCAQGCTCLAHCRPNLRRA